MSITREEIDNLSKGLKDLIELQGLIDNLTEKTINSTIDFIKNNISNNFNYIYRSIANELGLRVHKKRALLKLWKALNDFHSCELSFHTITTHFPSFANILYEDGLYKNAKYKKINDIVKENQQRCDVVDESESSAHKIKAAIVNDNIDYIIRCQCSESYIADANEVIKESSCDSILTLCAKFGAIKLFKYFLMSGVFPSNLTAITAVCGGNIEIIKLCMQQDIDFSNCANTAVLWHRTEILEWLIKNYNIEPISITKCISYYNLQALFIFLSPERGIETSCTINSVTLFPLYKACEVGLLPLVNFFCDHGADINQKTSRKSNILCVAAQEGNLDIVNYILDKGLDVDIKGVVECTPLYFASSFDYFDIVKCLVEHEADVNHLNKSGNSCFWAAAEKGNLEICKYLVSVGFDIHSNLGYLALCIAVKNGHTNVVEYILSNNVSPNFYGPPRYQLADNSHEVPLVYACLRGDINLVNLLLSKNALIDVKYSNMQPLYAACSSTSIECVKAILERNPNLESTNGKDNFTPLEIAAKLNLLEITKLLVEKGAKLGSNDVIMHAVISDSVEVLDYLASTKEFSIDKKTGESDLLLMFAVKQNKYQIAKLMIERGFYGDIDNKDSNGYSLLYIASKNGYIDIMKLLLDHGADIEAKNNNGSTPLCVACQECQYSAASILLTRHANVNITFAIGVTPLYIAAQNNHISIVNLLLETKPIVDMRSGDAKTPLYIAVLKGYIDIAEVLLKNGADPNIKIKGTTVLKAAATLEMKQLLLSYGAK